MCSPSKARREPKTPEVVAAWVGVVNDVALERGFAMLSIAAATGEAAYWVKRLTEQGRVQGYRLTHHETGKVYDLDCTFGGLDYATCDCPAACWNHAPYKCKHSVALAQALPLAGAEVA